MNQRYCRHCGAELKPDAKYCSECGEGTDAAKKERELDTGSHDDAWGQSDTPTAGVQDDGPDRTLAALAHVLGLFAWVVGPLIIYLVTEDEYAKENAANATDWQILFTIYILISIPLVFVLVGIVLLLVLPALDMVFCVVAAVKAYEGETWSYPFTPDIL